MIKLRYFDNFSGKNLENHVKCGILLIFRTYFSGKNVLTP